MEHRLHFFEGIPGSGKTTRSNWLKRSLVREKKECIWLHECEKNPLDLARHAILSTDELERLREQIAEKEQGNPHKIHEVIQKVEAVTEYVDDDIYIAFQSLYRDCDTSCIAYGLSPRDIYNGHFSFAFFREKHLKRWQTFARCEAETNTIFICDAILFQSPLFELMGYYDMKEAAILAYLSELISCVKELNPIIHYNRVSDIHGLMKRTCNIRKDDPDKWERGFYKWMEITPYFQRRNYHGFQGMCAFLEERQTLELRLLEQIGASYTIYDRIVE